MDRKKKNFLICFIILALISFVLAMVFKEIKDFGVATVFFMISIMMFHERKTTKDLNPKGLFGGYSSIRRYYRRRNNLEGYKKEMKMWIVLFSSIATICLLSGFIKIIANSIFN